MPSGKLVGLLGFKKAIVTGLLTMAAGAFLFLPAAAAPSFPFFMLALTVLAAGDTCLQVSGNPYVLALGNPRTGSSRLNLAQAFNTVGSTLAPFLGGWLIFRNLPKPLDEVQHLSASASRAYRLHEAASVKMPYLCIALSLLTIALAVALRKMPAGGKTRDAQEVPPGLYSGLWRNRQVVLGAVGIFVYVGAEITIGSFLVNYFGQPYIAGLNMRDAAGYVTLYWGGAMIGRFVGSAVLRKVTTSTALAISACIAFLLVSTSICSSGLLAMWSIILVGFFNSIMFPGLFALGIENLGPMTGRASGILMAAAVGGAIIPVLQGALADAIGIHVSFIVPALCYIYVAFYSFSRLKAKRAE
jgi:MFS transporter, FHS family, L-fucose permease